MPVYLVGEKLLLDGDGKVKYSASFDSGCCCECDCAKFTTNPASATVTSSGGPGPGKPDGTYGFNNFYTDGNTCDWFFWSGPYSPPDPYFYQIQIHLDCDGGIWTAGLYDYLNCAGFFPLSSITGVSVASGKITGSFSLSYYVTYNAFCQPVSDTLNITINQV